MHKDKAIILAFFEKSGQIRYETTLNGDYKKGNKEVPKLARVFRMFKEDRDFAQECIAELLKSENVVVRTDGAAYCLALNINAELGEAVLEEICNDPANGIFGFAAKMTLQVWRENGELNLYQHTKC